jgi:hypothetical protein
MTPHQRAHYFGKLWPAACKTQGWQVKDDAQRTRVTFAATGEESTSALDQDQVTLLFNKLKWLADPHNYDKALADADPHAALEESRRARVIWRIERRASLVPGKSESWLASLASAKCAAHGVADWRHLPTPELLRFSYTVSARTTEYAQAKRRGKAAKNSAAQTVQDDCSDDELPLENTPF